MASTDFEVRQLLKAYRKDLISDELFEAQMLEVRNGQVEYSYKGQTHATEREMVLHVLDEFRCAENFAAEYLQRWIEASDQECVKGGLRVVQQREHYHAQLLEARLRELGGIPQCTVAQERRDKELPFYASTEKTDAEKLLPIASRVQDPVAVFKPLNNAIAQIQEDQQSKELLRLLVDDEMSSVKWFLEASKLLNPQAATA
jgi:hypothetical protein